MHTPRARVLAALAATSFTFGCQLFSASVTSPSDSISATGTSISHTLESISASSGSEAGGEAKEASYGRDMSQYVAGFVRSGGDASSFASGATRIAASHGLSNWEADPKTPDAIGEGLAAANQSEAQARSFCSSVGLDADLSRQVVSAAKRHAD